MESLMKKHARGLITMLGITMLVMGGTALAQQAPTPSADPAKVEAGDYKIDPTHTRVIFSYKHLGFSTSYGLFTKPSAKIHFDPQNPSLSTLEVTFDMTGIDTTVAKLDEHLRSEQFFDVAKFPTATFRSTKVTMTGPTAGTIVGDLTVHGVTKPVTLTVTFNGGGVHPMAKVFAIGFDASGTIRRSEFGVGAYVPLVGDEVALTISAEFDKI